MSYPLSGEYHVAHGEANYLFLTAVFAEYQRENPDGELKELNEHLAGLLHCEVDQVYVEIDGEIVPFVTVDSATGDYHG